MKYHSRQDVSWPDNSIEEFVNACIFSVVFLLDPRIYPVLNTSIGVELSFEILISRKQEQKNPPTTTIDERATECQGRQKNSHRHQNLVDNNDNQRPTKHPTNDHLTSVLDSIPRTLDKDSVIHNHVDIQRLIQDCQISACNLQDRNTFDCDRQT
jgi:hypothetical protein